MTVAGDWLRVTSIGGDDYGCHMTILKASGTIVTVTRPWRHRWTDGWDWKTIIRQWLFEAPETLESYDGLAEWLRGADDECINCWYCLSYLLYSPNRRFVTKYLSDSEKKWLASDLLDDIHIDKKGRHQDANDPHRQL